MINLYDNKILCKTCQKEMSLNRAMEFNGLCEKCYNEQLFTIKVKEGVLAKFDIFDENGVKIK